MSDILIFETKLEYQGEKVREFCTQIFLYYKFHIEKYEK